MIQTVLVVEDNPADILLMQRAFRKQDLVQVSLQIVKDGDAAISYLIGDGEYSDRAVYPFPIIVLLDLKLPRRSGHEVLNWIREQPNFKRLPVVILTSSRQKMDVNQAYDLGANSYLVKPIGFTALLEMMHSFRDYWLEHNEQPELS